MTDKENMMIEALFKQAAQQQIEDNGFTERVMKNLPDRKLDVARRLSQLWTLFCLVVAGGCGHCSAWWWLVCCSSYLAAGRW